MNRDYVYVVVENCVVRSDIPGYDAGYDAEDEEVEPVVCIPMGAYHSRSAAEKVARNHSRHEVKRIRVYE